MDKRAWIIFVVAVVGVLIGLVAFSRQAKVDVTQYDNGKILTSEDKEGDNAIGDHVFGLPIDEAEVILIEYGDFQCPGCAQLYKTTEQVLPEYEDKISFVFRNFPLTTIHPNAKAAAAVAEAAGIQDKYWEMNSKLFNSQGNWEGLTIDKRDDVFNTYAKDLGLDVEQFKKDYNSQRVAEKISFDQALGKENGANATPTVFLNGEKLTSADFGSVADLKATLDKAIKEADKSASDKKE